MPFTLKKLLVVDHDPSMRQILAGLLRSQCGFFDVSSAGSLQEVLQIISEGPVSLIVTGFNLAEIAGVHLIEKLIATAPEQKILYMTTPQRQQVRTKIKNHPSLIYFDQTQNLTLLTRRICSELSIDYGGQLRGVTLSSFLQLLELDGRSCVLQVAAKGKVGYLAIKDGELINALYKPRSDDAKMAALQVLSWEDVTIEIDFSAKTISREIHDPLMMLMLESGRIDDEIQSDKANLRTHSRHTISLALDYDISDVTYQCFMRDISLGGAYIETDKDLPIGHIITLTLALPEQKRSYAIKGIVARKDERGVGIRFSRMTIGQKKVIQSFITNNVEGALRASEETSPAAISGPTPNFLGPLLNRDHS